VALYTAATSAERIAFHTMNRATGHRVQRRFVDSETGKPVEKQDQVRGYEIGKEDYVALEPEEIAEAIPEGDKTLSVEAFVDCDEIDSTYFDRHYYLAPSGRHAEEAFALIRDGMRARNVAALAHAVLFRRTRTLLIRAHGPGLIGTTLNFDYEVRSARETFSDVPAMKIKGEMLELAEHIIKTKKGKFDPSKFEDRYEAAVADLVKAKLEGKKIEPRRAPARGNVIDLTEALRKSAGVSKRKRPAKLRASRSSKAQSTPRRRKAG
jgi:DNA end-binding protein Ku